MTQMSEQASADGEPDRLHLYEELERAAPAEKAALVRALMARHPAGVLDLPRQGGKGANLDHLDLSQPSTGDAPLSLACALLQGASLESANLSGLDLSGADLRDAVLRRARLPEANLQEADMAGADLAGSELRRASLGRASLRGAMLEDADLQGASLRFADLSGAVLEGAALQGADLWGADLRDAVLDRADLTGAILNEANLEGAALGGARLGNAVLGQANLRGANLRGADLRGAELRGADLQQTVLSDARLPEVDLSGCRLSHACFAGALLQRTPLDVSQLGDATGEELAGDYEGARKSYLVLERNFNSLGDSDAASWAYRKRRRMQKKAALARAVEALRRRQVLLGLRCLARHCGDQLAEWVCDYGESVPRVLASLLALYLVFMGVYGATNSVVRVVETPAGPARVPTRQITDLAIFSLLAMTTSGTPAVGLQPSNELVHILTGVQALLGIALTGLLGFVLGNRIRR